MRLTKLCVLLTVAVATAACASDDEDASNIDAFCNNAREQSAIIVSPPMATQAEFEQSLEFYRLMGQLAPAAISDQWADLVHVIETAAAIEPGNVESEQLVAMTAYATEGSAYEVAVFLERNCGVTIPVTTIVPRGGKPSPIGSNTTVAPSASTPATTAP